jgi:acyl-CoA reductase-like NAD-dependent aldehyde dehydrogenase
MLAIRFPGVSRPAPSDEMQSFGPAVGVMKVASDEEAIRLMNYSSYDGLTASVCSSLCPLDPGADLRAAVERIRSAVQH